MPGVCVVYLVWGPLGHRPLERFAASYRAHRAGIEHQLVLALNGVGDAPLLARCEAVAAELGAHTLRLRRPVLDLEAYITAAGELESEHVCFLNSYSRILAGDWLAILAGAAMRPGVGLAGATGSWGSQLDYLRYQLGLSSAYAGVYGDRESTRQAMLRLSRLQDPAVRDRGRLAAQAGTLLMLVRQSTGFARFPTPHLRTNAFAISRRLLLELWPRRVPSKLAAYRLENGRASLTARVLEQGLGAVVAGRDGTPYEIERWPESETFWHGEQANLLIADNRTDDFAGGDAERRLLLSRYAWADRAWVSPAVTAAGRRPERA